MRFDHKPNTTSWEVRWTEDHRPDLDREAYTPNRYHSFDEDFATEEEAVARVGEVLRADKHAPDGVTVIKWRHEQNLPGCLPAVVGKSCSMDVYSLVEGEVVKKEIDIFGRSY